MLFSERPEPSSRSTPARAASPPRSVRSRWPSGCAGALLLALTTFLAQSALGKALKIDTLYRTLLATQAEVKTLSGLLSICAACKRIKDEQGPWNRMERYVSKRAEVSFSHGYCPECAVKFCEAEGLTVPPVIRAEFEEGSFDP